LYHVNLNGCISINILYLASLYRRHGVTVVSIYSGRLVGLLNFKFIFVVMHIVLFIYNCVIYS